MPEFVNILIINGLAVMVLFALAWAACVAQRDCTPVDSLWGLGMGVVALSTFIQTGGGTERRIVMTAICVAWAVRLGGYMLWRWRDHGPDRRYVRMMDKAKVEKGWNYGYAAFRLVFLLQMPLLWLVCLPVQLGQVALEPAVGWIGWAGAVLAVIGIGFESIGDAQLTAFRNDPSKKGKVLDTGLWRWTRHPNYFGDACVWWGLFLIAAETGPGMWAIAGPLFLTFTLTKWSGIGITEKVIHASRPGYADYVRRTSAFIPWPPKKG